MRLAVLLCFGVGLCACQDSSGPKQPEPASITFAATPTNLVPGQESVVQATVKASNGSIISQAAVSWSSSNISIATVSATGTVKAVAAGSATITARSAAATANFNVSVDEGGIAGASGATITAFNGGVTLVVPAAAVSNNTVIKFRAVDAPSVDPTHLRSSTVAVEAGSATFAVPARLSLSYDPAEAPIGLSESRLGMRALSGTDWSAIAGGNVDITGNKVTADIPGPGSYAVGLAPSATPCTAAEHRLFDFRIGSYTWAGPNNLTGEADIVAETSGCALHETLRINGGNTVRAVFFYEPSNGQWHYTSVDGNSISRLSGGPDVDRMILYTPNRDRRVVWEKISADAHRQAGEVAAAGGTWTRLAAGVYTRKVVVTPDNVLTPAGGTITLLNGAVKIVAPAGAVTQNVTIAATIRSSGGPLDASLVRGEIYTLTAMPAVTFQQPVNVTIAYTPHNGPSGVPESHFGLAHESSGVWQMASATTVNTEENKVSGNVTSFGMFAARRAPQTGCDAAEHRQFDFWVGDWNVNGVHSSITREESGCAVFENWRGNVPGRSLNVYDAGSKKWHQTYVTANSPPLIMSGGLVDGKMVMYEYDTSGNIRSRWTWETVDANTVTQKAESTTNNGATYTLGFILTYVRQR